MKRVKYWMKKSPLGNFLYRLLVGLVGGGVTVLGGIAIIGPGPGILLLLAGLGILASEFAWAGEVMMHTKRIALAAEKRSGLKPWVKYFIMSGFMVASIIYIYLFVR